MICHGNTRYSEIVITKYKQEEYTNKLIQADIQNVMQYRGGE